MGALMASHYLRTTSTLDGEPVIVVVSEFSKNRKTGAMLQTWILRDSESPIDAARTGADISVCGDCPRRWYLGGDCYVIPLHGPHPVWKGVQSGSIKPLDLDNPPIYLMRKPMRLGAYGDPAAVPFELWARLMESFKVERWTGYTHQWLDCDTRFQSLLMASVDSESERLTALALGWRTFRVRSSADPILAGEFACPASTEQGHRLTCETCYACDGGSVFKANPVIVAHGNKNRRGLIGLRHRMVQIRIGG